MHMQNRFVNHTATCPNTTPPPSRVAVPEVKRTFKYFHRSETATCLYRSSDVPNTQQKRLHTSSENKRFTLCSLTATIKKTDVRGNDCASADIQRRHLMSLSSQVIYPDY